MINSPKNGNQGFCGGLVIPQIWAGDRHDTSASISNIYSAIAPESIRRKICTNG
jgi:hypothetical protein